MGSCGEADTAPERGAPGSSDIAYTWFLYGCRDLFFGKKVSGNDACARFPEHGFCSVVVGGERKSILPL